MSEDPLGTNEDVVDQLERLERAASPGPWRATGGYVESPCGECCTPEGCPYHSVRGASQLEGPSRGERDGESETERVLAYALDGGMSSMTDLVFSDADAELIATMRNALSVLLARIRKAEAEVALVRGREAMRRGLGQSTRFPERPPRG